MQQKLYLLIIACLLSLSINAADQPRELENAKITEAQLKIGKIVWLETAAEKFFTVYTQTINKGNLGTVILLHDIEGYPNKKPLIHDLRTRLPNHNWATIALQMPARETNAELKEYYGLFEDAKQRVNATIDFLQQNNVKNIVLVGYGLGAMMAVYSAVENTENLLAVVAVSLAAPTTNHPHAQITELIRKINIPLLDIYAEHDWASVTASVRKRKIAGRDNPHYRNVSIPSAKHDFQHNAPLLSKRIYSWLSRTFRKRENLLR